MKMYGPTLSTEIVTAIFLRFEELLRKAGKMDMFETLVYNYRLKENLPFQCLQRFASILNDLIRQLTELSVALEAGTHISQIHKTDYECGPDCEAVVNRFCLMESLLESNDLADFGMNCSETEICEPADGDDATVDLIGETVAILEESDILISRQQPSIDPAKDNKQVLYSGHELLLPMPNSDSSVSMPCPLVGDGILELNSNVCSSLPVGIQSLDCNQRFLNEGINQNALTSNFKLENSSFPQDELDSVIECDETFIAVADEVLKMRQETLERNKISEIEVIHKRRLSENMEAQSKPPEKLITLPQAKPVQCKQCNKTFLTEKGLKSHEGLTHKRNPEALAKQRKEEELILQKIGVLTGVASPNIHQSASFQEITAAATNNLNRSITNSQKRALASCHQQKETKIKPQNTNTGKGSNFRAQDLVQCHQCGKTFMTEKGLKSHEGLVHKKAVLTTGPSENGTVKTEKKVGTTQDKPVQMPSQCKTCGKTFMTEKGLKSHEGLVHKKVQDKNKSQPSKYPAITKTVTTPPKKTVNTEVTNANKVRKVESGISQTEKQKIKSKTSNTINLKKECIINLKDIVGSQKKEPIKDIVGSQKKESIKDIVGSQKKESIKDIAGSQKKESIKDIVGSQKKESINLRKISKSHPPQDQKKVAANTVKFPQAQTEKKKTESNPKNRKGSIEKSKIQELPKLSTEKSPKESHLKKDQLKKVKIEIETKDASLGQPVAIRKGLRKREKPKMYEDIANEQLKKRKLSSIQEKPKGESETSSDFTSDDDIYSWIVCEKCVLVFKTIDDFHKHNCTFLGDKFELPGSYSMAYIHDKTKLDSLHKFVCSICSEEFRSYQRICYHMRKCEIGPYFCEVCPAATPPFDSMKLLNSHKRSEHREQNSYICNECGHAFKFKNSLNKHKVQVHELNGSPDIYKCELCNDEFPKKVILTNHKIQVHGQQRQFLCQICGSQFSSFASLTSHHAATHDSYKKFQCNFCDKRFPRKDKLLHHEATHTGEKPFCCDICGKRFVRKIRLDDHRRRHTAERRYRCPEKDCLKLFASQPDLNNHLKRHAIEKEKAKLIEKGRKKIQECVKMTKTIKVFGNPIKLDIPTKKEPTICKIERAIPNNFTQVQIGNIKREDFPPNFLNLQSEVAGDHGTLNNEEYRMNSEQSAMENVQDRVNSLSEQDSDLFQLEYSPSNVYVSNQQFPQSSSSIQYDPTDTDGNNLMDISELDSHLYASQMDIHLSLDEDSKTLNNNLNELSDMIAQEMCHPNSFDTPLC